MTTTLTPTSVVTYVTMRMFVNGETFPVAQMASDFIILDRSIELPPCDAEIIMEVDGVPTHYNVRLPAGVSASHRRTPVEQLE